MMRTRPRLSETGPAPVKMRGLCVILLLSALTLSEGRVLSRCELRDELIPRVTLSRNLRRQQQRVMARVVCEVERLSSLRTHLVREYEKEIFDLDVSTTTTVAVPASATALRPTAPPSTATLTNTTAGPSKTSSSPSPAALINFTASANTASAATSIASANAAATASVTPPSTGAINASRTSPVAVRRRRAVRQRRASISVVSAKFFGIFQFSDRKYCVSGLSYSSEDTCVSDCFAFIDDDLSDDLDCFVQSGKFWEVFRGAHSSCKRRRTQNSFFDACDAGATPPPEERVVARVFLSGGNYK